MNPVDTALLRREADEWAKVETALGVERREPSVAALLRGAADEIDRLRKELSKRLP